MKRILFAGLSLVISLILITVVVYSTAYAEDQSSTPSESDDPNLVSPSLKDYFPAIISNGSGLSLGVRDEANLGTGGVGLDYLGTEAIDVASNKEGWGILDNYILNYGYADLPDGVNNMTVDNFASTSSEATSNVIVASTFEVEHKYRPSTQSPNLYVIEVSVKNISVDVTDVHYRRRMDWDGFQNSGGVSNNHFVTIQGTDSTPEIVFASDSASPEPIPHPVGAQIFVNLVGDGVDISGVDRGAIFDFDFGDLAPGETLRFKLFYGAASDEATALAAIASENIVAYSFDQGSTDPDTLTFIFGYARVDDIQLNKTVGTKAGICAPTDVISVTVGTEVTYCYEVTNTSDLTLTLHTLEDDQLGTILNNASISLPPGGSVTQLVTETITNTVTNTAVWTATTPISATAVFTDSASATVSVIPPSISLNKTVGVIPGACAATDNVGVFPGDTVYYCYTVTNTGGSTLTTHDLADDQLGQILTGFPATLPPGASYSLIYTTTIADDTVNVGTWTAASLGIPDIVTASDTAQVDVFIPVAEPLTCLGGQTHFEDGIPTDWTVVDNAGTGIVWESNASDSCDIMDQGGPNVTNGTGYSACVDSDEAGLPALPYDTELVSPPFSLVGVPYGAVTADIYYRDIFTGNDMLMVDVFDGSSWNNYASYDSTVGATSIEIDLNSLVGKPNIQIRFRYVGDGYDWYAQVDNIALECFEPTAVQLNQVESTGTLMSGSNLTLVASVVLLTVSIGWLGVVRRRQSV